MDKRRKKELLKKAKKCIDVLSEFDGFYPNESFPESIKILERFIKYYLK